LVLIISASVVFVGGTDCVTNPDYDSSSPFIGFFDECLIDKTESGFFGYIAGQIKTWFNLQLYPIYVVISVFVITIIFFHDDISPEDAARGNCARLHGHVFLIRLGLVIGMVPWLWSALTQERPCVCRANSAFPYTPLYSTWGMPAGGSFGATVFGLHFLELVNIPFGVLFILLVSACDLVDGEASLGQVLVGILFGLAIHFYTTRTPIFVSVFNFFASFVAGVITLFVAKSQYEKNDFSFAVFFVVGIVWQLYGFILLLVSFEWEFVRVAIRRSSHVLHEVDFMYYKPLNSPPSDPDRKEYPHEVKWMTFYTIVLFAGLCALKFAEQYVDEFLGFWDNR